MVSSIIERLSMTFVLHMHDKNSFSAVHTGHLYAKISRFVFVMNG